MYVIFSGWSVNHRGTKIRAFRVCFRAPFLPPFFPHFSPSFPFTLPPLLHSSLPPLSPLLLFSSRGGNPPKTTRPSKEVCAKSVRKLFLVVFCLSLQEKVLKFRRVTIRGAKPSARLSEEICLSEGSAGVSQRARGSLRGFCGALRGSAGVRGIFRGFSGVVTLCL